MEIDLIKTLRETLTFSPANIPLCLTLADALFSNQAIQEAEAEYKFVLDHQSEDIPAKIGLAKVYFEQEKYSIVIVIVEELRKPFSCLLQNAEK